MVQLLNNKNHDSYKSINHFYLDGFPWLLIYLFHQILIFVPLIAMGRLV